jgi:hypothetical protein
MTDQYIVGEVYFRITYPGPSLNYPMIESFVFVGKNLSDEDAEETWYFQFADSYAKFGSILANSEGDRRVACVTQTELQEMFNEEQLLENLRVARQRRSSKGTV